MDSKDVTATSKSLIGNFETCVRDNMLGYVATHPGLRILENSNVILHEDILLDRPDSDKKVALISGGGSGHEPLQAGYVGPGMLSAAVAGEIFASPSATSILCAIEALYPKSSGILLIVPSYTGDCLNFGLALERARLRGLNIEAVTVGEDCAFHGLVKKAGRRGLCGMIIVHKIGGALADQGKSLKEIHAILQEATTRLGTISFSLTPCNIPGRGPSFTLGPDELELGLGIHGEAGVQRIKVQPAKEIVKIMFDHMIHPNSSCRLDVKDGDHIALMVNNLGGLSQFEFNVCIKELVSLLDSKNIVVDRMYCGTLVTSLDMAGVSFTILKLNDLYRACLDAPTKAPAWPKVFVPERSNYVHSLQNKNHVVKEQHATDDSVQLSGPSLNPEAHGYLIKAIEEACKSLVEKESHLNFLDRGAGDGDCGSTLRKGAEAILVQIKNGSISLHPHHIFLTLALIVENHMGGSSGALYSLFFTGGAGAFENDCSVSTWCKALKLGIDAISKYGGAEPGDRTMLDVLYPAYDALIKERIALESLEHRKDSIGRILTLIETAAKQTVTMKAKAGRSSYVNPERLVNPDPGAEAVAIWLSAALKIFL